MRYEINGTVTTLYDNKNKPFIIDTDQLDKVLLYNWYVDNCKGYVRTASRKLNRITLHRYLLGVNQSVDHINRKPNDNRLCNLRVCTLAENNLNKGVRKDSSTGVKGVEYQAGKNKPYRARIQYKGERLDLGYFKTLDEARQTYEAKAKELFKTYAPY